MPVRRPLSVVVCLLVAAPLAYLGSPASAAPVPVKPYDFNRDGYPELVVGATSLLSGTDSEGGVAVFAASRSGLSKKAQVLNAAALGISRDEFGIQRTGSDLASGDFDGDGYADLAITRPVATERYAGAGAVTVLYGSAKGLDLARPQKLVESGGPSDDARFGASLVAADFDGDGRADLAVGAPYAEGARGTVSVFSGGAEGLAQDRSTVRRGGRTGAVYEDYFGLELAAGDLDEDGRPDLVVGARGPAVLSVCFGAAQALGTCSQLTRSEISDQTYTIAVGNVSGTTRPEIVLGIGDVGPRNGGAVQTLSLDGPRTALTAVRTELTQDSPGVRGNGESADAFGADVVLGDLDRDGYDDLVVGAPGEDKGKGRVTVVYGGPGGYRTSGGRIYDQDTKGVPGKAEKDDDFGTTVALLDHDADGHLDLTVGAPRENDFAGAVTLLRGKGDAFTTKGARTVTLKDVGYADPGQDTFGDALAR